MIEFIKKKAIASYWLTHKEGWTVYVRRNGGDWKRVKFNGRTDGLTKTFMADPFFFKHDGKIWLFFETVDASAKGRLACCVLESGVWRYVGVCLEEPWHLSYPQVFEDNGKVYMIPESCKHGEGDVCLYEAIDFPLKWRKKMVLIDEPFADSTILKHDGVYYLACYKGATKGGRAELWVSNNLEKGWKRHSQSHNINQSKRLSRCGGRYLEDKGSLWRIAQDCNGYYGKRLFKVPVLMVGMEMYEEGVASLLIGKQEYPKGFKHTYGTLELGGGGLLEVVDVQEPAWRNPIEVMRILRDRLALRFARK